MSLQTSSRKSLDLPGRNLDKPFGEWKRLLEDAIRAASADSSSVAENALLKDGTVSLTANWDAGDFVITAGGYVSDASITLSGLTASRMVLTNGSKVLESSTKTDTDMVWRDGTKALTAQWDAGAFPILSQDTCIFTKGTAPTFSGGTAGLKAGLIATSVGWHYGFLPRLEIAITAGGSDAVNGYCADTAVAQVSSTNTTNLTGTWDNASYRYGGLHSMFIGTYHNANCTVTEADGVVSLIRLGHASAIMTSGFNYRATCEFGATGASIGSRYGFYVKDAVNNPTYTGAMTNQYGLYIEDLDYATNNYGIYFAGTSGLNRQGIWWNGDTNLFRYSANLLCTDDTFQSQVAVIAGLTDGVDYVKLVYDTTSPYIAFKGALGVEQRITLHDVSYSHFDITCDVDLPKTEELRIYSNNTLPVYSTRITANYLESYRDASGGYYSYVLINSDPGAGRPGIAYGCYDAGLNIKGSIIGDWTDYDKFLIDISLKIDQNLHVVGTTTLGALAGILNATAGVVSGSAATVTALGALRLPNVANAFTITNRIRINNTSSGTCYIEWYDGASDWDVNLGRTGTNTLGTSDSFRVGGDLTVAGGDITGANSTSLDIGGNVAGKLRVISDTFAAISLVSNADDVLVIQYRDVADVQNDVAQNTILRFITGGGKSVTFFDAEAINADGVEPPNFSIWGYPFGSAGRLYGRMGLTRSGGVDYFKLWTSAAGGFNFDDDPITTTGLITGGTMAIGADSVLPAIDEDSFASNLDTKVPTQQSTKAYIATQVHKGYPLQAYVTTAWNPTDGQTVYFGSIGRAPSTTQGLAKIYIPKTGTIKAARVFVVSITTAGSNAAGEDWVANIRLNGTSSTLIQSILVSNLSRMWENSSLNLAVSAEADDYIEIELVNPNWGTNPQGCYCSAVVYIE